MDPREVTVSKFRKLRKNSSKCWKLIFPNSLLQRKAYIRVLARDLGEILGVGALYECALPNSFGDNLLREKLELGELIEEIKSRSHEEFMKA